MLLRDFITLLGGAACTTLAATVASGQSAGKISRIGVLCHAGSADEEAINLKAIRQGLSDYGYIEGKNIILENRFPAEQPGRFISFAAELVALNVDVLVAITSLGGLAAQHATKTIPIVFVFVPDPVGMSQALRDREATSRDYRILPTTWPQSGLNCSRHVYRKSRASRSRAAHKTGISHQPQDREGARPRFAAYGSRARRRCDRRSVTGSRAL